jgi:predicted nucleic acid-binding protein
MRLYVESSAVLAWLLDESAAPPVERALHDAEVVVGSELTVLETERVLVRAVAASVLTPEAAETCRDRLRRASDCWMLMRIHGRILHRAGRPFPVEPVRTLDAIHLASALEARDVVPGLRVLSLDRRIREHARALGIDTVPDD